MLRQASVQPAAVELFLILHLDIFHFLNFRDYDCVSSGSLKHNPACPYVFTDERHQFLPPIRVRHFGRDGEKQPTILGQNNQRRPTLHAVPHALATHALRIVIKVLNWTGNIPNQTFYGFVGNICPGTRHIRGLWRLRRRQENSAARKQANTQRSDHRFSFSAMLLMERLIIAQYGRWQGCL